MRCDTDNSKLLSLFIRPSRGAFADVVTAESFNFVIVFVVIIHKPEKREIYVYSTFFMVMVTNIKRIPSELQI